MAIAATVQFEEDTQIDTFTSLSFRSHPLNTEVFELSEEEISLISGGAEIAPPTALSCDEDYPIIENNPP
jgi:hypothetical protein